MRIQINTGIKKRSGKSINTITALTCKFVGEVFCVAGGYLHLIFLLAGGYRIATHTAALSRISAESMAPSMRMVVYFIH